MKVILLFVLFFLLTMTYLEFKKSKSLDKFKELIKGTITGVTPTDNGVYFDIEYKDKEEIKIFKHQFNKNKLTLEKVNFLAEHYLTSPFYLLGKKDGDLIVDVKPYSNAKIMKWLYLLGTLITGLTLVCFF